MSAVKLLNEYRMNGNSTTRQHSTRGAIGRPNTNMFTAIGDLYFHHVFQRDTLSENKRPILEPIFQDGRSGQICLIDGEQCTHRLFGGGFQEWWTGGAYNETMDMIRNLEYYAFTKKCYIIIAFAGRMHPATEAKIKQYRRQEFLSTEYQLVVKAKKALDKTSHSPSGFTLPVGFRCFTRQYDLGNLKIVSTPGDHVATICKWLGDGLPANAVPKTCTSTKIDALLGYRNEYILKLMGQKQIKYFHSPSLKLGRADRNNVPSYFQASCIVPNCFKSQKSAEANNLAMCALLLDGDSEFLPGNELDGWHAELLKHQDEYSVLQEIRQSPGSLAMCQRFLEVCRLETELNTLAGQIKQVVESNEEKQNRLDIIGAMIYGNRAKTDKTLKQNLRRAINRLEEIIDCKLLDPSKDSGEAEMALDRAESMVSTAPSTITMATSEHESQDIFYNRLYELDDDYPTEEILTNIFQKCVSGACEPMVYQAITTGTVYLHGGGVYDYRHNAYENPQKLFQAVREVIYTFLFPTNTDMDSEIGITEYYHHQAGNSSVVSVKPMHTLEHCKTLLMATEPVMDRNAVYSTLNIGMDLGLDVDDLKKIPQVVHWEIALILKYLKSQGVKLLKTEVAAIVRTAVNGTMAGGGDMRSTKFDDMGYRGMPPPNLDRIQWISCLIHQGYYHFAVLFEVLGLNKPKQRCFRPATTFSGRYFRETVQDNKPLKAGADRKQTYDAIMSILKA